MLIGNANGVIGSFLTQDKNVIIEQVTIKKTTTIFFMIRTPTNFKCHIQIFFSRAFYSLPLLERNSATLILFLFFLSIIQLSFYIGYDIYCFVSEFYFLCS